MGEYFKPLRRKAGCILLTVALVIVGGWIRVFSVQDTFVLQLGRGSTVQLVSACHRIILLKTHTTSNSPPRYAFWTAYPGERDAWRIKIGDAMSMPEASNEFQFQFGFGTNVAMYSADGIQIPYWSLAIPLTMLSGALILWPARKPAGHSAVELLLRRQ